MAFCLAAVLATGFAAADVLPPQAARLSERFQSNPSAFDRTDAPCEGQGVGNACTVPGTAFEGGGPGKCERGINRNEYRFIDLRCTPDNPPQIDRQMASQPYQADSYMCADILREPDGRRTLAAMGLVCETPAPVSDRFCKGQAPGDSCVAQVRVGDAVVPSNGICKSETETSSIYRRGRQQLTRPVVLCRPETDPVPAVLTPVGAWRKLFQ
jgi:hypothetical protein